MANENTTILERWLDLALLTNRSLREASERVQLVHNYENANNVTYLMTYATPEDLDGLCVTLDELNEIFENLMQFSVYLGTHNGNTGLTPLEVLYKNY